MTDFEYPWQESYREALLECDPTNLKEKVIAAENAIFTRTQELSGKSDPSERQAMQDALRALRLLQTEMLGYPKLPNENKARSANN
jgi:hypothetical protein